MQRPLTAGETAGALFMMVVFAVAIVAVVLVAVKGRVRALDTTHFITEADPAWVPRFPGSMSTPVVAGQCGQWDGRRWHRVACPGVDR